MRLLLSQSAVCLHPKSERQRDYHPCCAALLDSASSLFWERTIFSGGYAAVILFYLELNQDV